MSKPAPMDEVVRGGYDDIAEKYLSSRDQLADMRFLDQLIERLPARATVLDLGCGLEYRSISTSFQRSRDHRYRPIGEAD